MRNYEVKKNLDGQMIVINTSNWNWLGFLFTWIYLLIKKQWNEGAIIAVVAIFVSFFPEFVSRDSYDAANILSYGIGIGIWIYVGLNANSWMLKKYAHLPSVNINAMNKTHALQLAMEEFNNRNNGNIIEKEKIEVNPVNGLT